MVLERLALDADEVAAQRQVIGRQLDAYGSGLQRATPLIDDVLVVTKDAAVGHFGARMEAIGHSLQTATSSMARQPIHSGRIGILEESLTAKRGYMPIGHTVAKNDEMADRPTPIPPWQGGSRMYLSVKNIIHYRDIAATTPI